MRLAAFVILSLLSCALSSESRDENDRRESYARPQTSNLKVTISGRVRTSKDERSLSTSTDTTRKRVNIPSDYNPLTQGTRRTEANITRYPVEATRPKYVHKSPLERETETATDILQPGDSDEITYVAAKGSNQTRDGIRHEFLNASRISESSVVTNPVEREKEDQVGDEKNKGTEKEFTRQEEPFSSVSLRSAGDVQGDMTKWSTNVKSDAPREAEVPRARNDSAAAGEDFDIGGVSSTGVSFVEESPNRLTVVLDPGIANHPVESRTDQEENWQVGEDDLMEAANFGLQAMHNLYYVQEPKLYSMGLYLKRDEPARYVAAFNDQSEEARNLARFGYATLQGTAMYLKKFPGAPLELPLSRSTRRTSLEQQCPRRGTPQCPPASLRYRTSDGSCNNLQDLWWGSAMSTMQRFLPAVYQDGVQSIRRSTSGRPLPSARDITGLIHEDQDVPLASVTHMLMQWGQFVDHDLTATGQSRGFNGTVPQCCLPRGVGFQPPEFMHPECLPIAVNLRDSFYGPLGVRCLEFLRSGPAPKEGCEFGTREQLSQVTSYLDASMVYSSNALHSDSLRLFRNGLLQYGKIQSRRPMLPKHEFDLCKLGSLSTTCFRAGDGRLSEQPALTSLHVVFLRLHNRIATELSALNSHWSDEKLFQETRRIVGAVVQHITYREFLPIILGPQVMKIFDLEVLKKGYYEGYDPTVNPNVANAFSTAAYRFGHSLVQRTFVRFDSNHRPLPNNVSIHEEFSNPANLETAGSVDRLVLGLANQPCQRRDEFITEEMTNHLFQTPGFAFGMDLASLNIQRGRDHGLPPYVRWREPCGLSPIRTFEDLDTVMSPSIARKFRLLYSSVEDIDLFPAGLGERSVVGGLVGPIFACIIGQQFSNLRRGDRFWYENPESESSFTAGQLQQIRRTTLAQVLCKTMDAIETIQPFVFLAADTLKNRRLACDDPAIGQLDLEFWAERPFEFRYNVRDPQAKVKRTASDVNDPAVSRSNVQSANTRRKVLNGTREQAKIAPPEQPFKSNIHQSNKIILKKPIGQRPDNLTIWVQNNAVNSPVFVNDGIYGSSIRLQQQSTAKPTSAFNQGASNYLPHRPPAKPIPTTIPLHSGYPYVPQAYDDPNNPNPLAYGYKSPTQGDVFYDNYSPNNPSSPRPTLYTYYTNFQQRPTTQTPNREVNGYLINYGHPHHEHDSFPAHHTYEKPEPQLVNLGHPYGSSAEQGPSPQRPSYSDAKPSATNVRPSSRPNYASNDGTYHKPGYDGVKPLTISRPNFGTTHGGSSDELYHGQKPSYNRPRPTSPNTSRPNEESYHTQKPVHSGPILVLNSRPSSTANYQPYSTQGPATTGNSHLQSNYNNLSNRPGESYPANSYKPQHVNQGNLNGYQERPGERPYDYDDPDAYQKRPNVKLQSGPYTNPGTNVPSHEKDTSNSSPAYSQGSTASDNYGKYPDTSLAYQSRPTSTQSNWPGVSSDTKESSAPSFELHSSPFYQKPTTGRPVYQISGQSQVSPYQKESIDASLPSANPYEEINSYESPGNPAALGEQSPYSIHQQNQPTPASYWPEVSTVDFHVHKQTGKPNPKPSKVQSVTIVTEAIETVHNPGHSGYIDQYKVTSEVPRPLAQQTKNNMPVTRRPGQYYYEKNVLHRYPDEVAGQILQRNSYSTDNVAERTPVQDRGLPSKKIVAETTSDDSITDVSPPDSKTVERSESKAITTTMLTLAITDYRDNNRDDVVDDLEGAFAAVVESVASTDVPDRINHWTNPQEDPNLPSTLEMPGFPSNETPSAAKELPKPIKSRSRAT
ncbi:uncharacterized protein LOC116841308 isoform X2 [Odontomachus brunneus]|uniref:uncharacterized protein LOC116841308 isoform X2 n=1 Tax=Odontomachus brunneus TaxID=486640 RepID=UPI0013F22934|nr:uncharacterized protein LOC116841308 isoform X2 [Odontomachus brunneus]